MDFTCMAFCWDPSCQLMINNNQCGEVSPALAVLIGCSHWNIASDIGLIWHERTFEDDDLCIGLTLPLMAAAGQGFPLSSWMSQQMDWDQTRSWWWISLRQLQVHLLNMRPHHRVKVWTYKFVQLSFALSSFKALVQLLCGSHYVKYILNDLTCSVLIVWHLRWLWYVNPFVKDGAMLQNFQMPFTRLLSSFFNFYLSLFGWVESLVAGAVLDPTVKVSDASDKSSLEKTFLPSPLSVISVRRKCQLPVSFGEIRAPESTCMATHSRITERENKYVDDKEREMEEKFQTKISNTQLHTGRSQRD